MAQRLSINMGKNTLYEIVFENNFEGLKKELEFLSLQSRKVCIVTDSNVNLFLGDEVNALLKEVALKVTRFVFSAGEESKNLDTVEQLYQYLIEEHFDRNDVLIALGGGVVGDLTGYVAATYLRGISFVQIPTTLLAQVDSSIGGKTGVDYKQYKNMIGAFHMPKLVYTNLSVLNTLPERQFFSGMAEVMKAGLIKDAAFYEWLISNMYEICEKDDTVLEEMVVRSCQIKKYFVEKDPTEKKERALLNLGHTIGHAIEKAKNFTLLHGECVALGCVAAAYISYQKKYLSAEEFYEIRDMFVPFYLPITVADIIPEEIVADTKSDKKMDGEHIRFILLKKIGKAMIDLTVTEEEMLAAVQELHFKEEDFYE